MTTTHSVQECQKFFSSDKPKAQFKLLLSFIDISEDVNLKKKNQKKQNKAKQKTHSKVSLKGRHACTWYEDASLH